MSWNGVGLENLKIGRVLVRRVDRLEIGEDQPAEVLQRLPDVERREGDVGRGEGLAVVPGHAFAQLEGDRKAVGRAFPACREPRREPVLALEGSFRQRLDHLAGDEEHAVRGDDGRVEVLRLGIGRDDEAACLPGRMPFRGRAVAAAKIAVLCSSARRVSENLGHGSTPWSSGVAHRAKRRDASFRLRDSLARGMLFCTEPRAGKISVSNRRARATCDATLAGGVADGYLGVEAGAQWELLPEGAPAGRALTGPPQHDKSTERVDPHIPLSRNNTTLARPDRNRRVPPPESG